MREIRRKRGLASSRSDLSQHSDRVEAVSVTSRVDLSAAEAVEVSDIQHCRSGGISRAEDDAAISDHQGEAGSLLGSNNESSNPGNAFRVRRNLVRVSTTTTVHRVFDGSLRPGGY